MKKTISFPVVGIGGSAGGLEAFKNLLGNLPDNTGMAFVFIMHLLPDHKSMLAELLAEVTKMPVNKAKNGMLLRKNHVYVIPPHMNIFISAGKLRLSDINKTGVPHMPVDYFFRSLAKEAGPRAIGIILSGTATDGTLGAGEIKAGGGIIFAQDGESSRYDGMPQNAIASGCVDFVLSPKKIAEKLMEISKSPILSRAESFKMNKLTVSEKGFEEIFGILLAARGLDFTNYKDATITRRILRRMALLRFEKLKDYVKFLRENKEEAVRLYEDLLISVTVFFRDPGVFETLKKLVLPAILKKKTKDRSVRIWVPGCSSGEDVYTIAICLIEVLENRTGMIPVQIFATDVSENNINKARRGVYGKNISENITAERLKRFFTKEGNSYKVSKQLREMCVFSKQNVFNDPPFSNIDLIICRNLLIYLKPVLQKKVFHNFHYSLVPGGFLLLGNSESVGSGYSSFFNTLDRKHKIFVKKYIHSRVEPEFNRKYYRPKKTEIKEDVNVRKNRETDFENIIEKVILDELAPCGVLINNNMEVVQFRGHTGRYLESTTGKPSLDIFKLVRDGLLFPLRAALYKAKSTKRMVRREAENVRYNNRRRRVNITVIPVRSGGLKNAHFLILFEEAGMQVSSKKAAKVRRKSIRDEKYIEEMQRELLETKEYLQTVIEGLDSSNEELKTANEEILSSNEELQSANEELETSKEELQCANEELVTANEELNNRNAEVSFLNNDLMNLLGSINMPVIMMDTALVIRRVTSQVERVLDLTSSDIGRSINKIKLGLEIPGLEKTLLDVIESLRPKTFEIKDKNKNWYSVYIKPYRTMDNRIDGVIMIFVDITEHRRAEEARKETEERYKTLIENINLGVCLIDKDYRLITINNAFCKMFGITKEAYEGRHCFEVCSKNVSVCADCPGTKSMVLKKAVKMEKEYFLTNGIHLPVIIHTYPVFDSDNNVKAFIKIMEDMSEYKKVEKAKKNLIRDISHSLKTPIAMTEMAFDIVKNSEIAGNKENLERANRIASENLKRLRKDINNILQEFAIDVNEDVVIKDSKTSLKAVVAKVVNDLNSFAEIKNLRVDMDLPLDEDKIKIADRDLETILSNLLENAIKFTDKGKISITGRCREKTVEIEIKDTGCGISPKDIKMVFDKFFKRHASIEGTGLGLSICKELVEIYKGEINVYSEGIGKGTTVVVSLPKA